MVVVFLLWAPYPLAVIQLEPNSVPTLRPFSARQQEVLELMLQGLPSRLMADQLGISVNTIKEHRRVILRRMEVDSTLALIHKMHQTPTLDGRPEVEKALTIPPKVLVVEDDDPYWELVVSALKLAEFDCRGVSNTVEMGHALDTLKPQVVVLDLNLGTEDGLVIAHDLRERFPSLGIVIMTIRGMAEERIEGLIKGADAYLVKPVDIRELINVIRNLHRRVVLCQAASIG